MLTLSFVFTNSWGEKVCAFNRSFMIMVFFRTYLRFSMKMCQYENVSLSRARVRKLPVHVHMTHVVKIDIITGHEEKGNLPFIL